MSNMNWGRFGLTLGGYILGALVGYALGVPMLGAALGGIVGGVVGSLVFPNDPTRIQGPRLQNLVQTSEYGWPIPILFGHDRVGGCVVWAGTRQEHEKEEGEGGKGGGGGGEVVYTSYYYTQSFAVKICRGPVAKLFRIWADNKLIYDCKPENDGPVIGQDLRFTFYPGDEEQMPDPVIESYKGIGNVTAFRGDCYIVFQDMNITDYGGRIPNLNFEVATAGADAYPEVEVDIGGLLGEQSTAVGQMLLGHNGEYALLRHNEHWAVVDIISNRVLAAKVLSSDIPGSAHCDIDDMGNIYGLITVEGYTVPFCMDRELNILATSTDQSSSKLRFIAVSRGTGAFIWTGGAPSNRDGDVVLYNRIGLTKIRQWAVSDIVGTTDHILSHLAIDPNTNCAWVIAQITDGAGNPTGLSYLLRFTPGTGIPAMYQITPPGGPYGGPNILGICSETNRIFLSGSCPVGAQVSFSQPAIWVWDIEAEAIIAQFGPEAYDGHDYGVGYANLRDIKGGMLWVERDETHYVAINTATLEITREYEQANWTFPFHQYHFIYDAVCNALWPMFTRGEDGVFVKLLLDRASRETVLLGDIVQSLCEEVGLTAADLDLTEIASDEVRGYCISQQMTVRQAIEPLQQAFFWDCAEIDGKITAIKRGGTSVVTIPEADLAVVEEGQDRPDELPIIRAQEVELPRVLNIAYTDIDQAYQPGNQRSIRQTTESVGEHTITLPLVLTATEAKRIAETLHQIAWLERNSYAPIFLPPKYLYLTVTDVITVTRGGNTYLLHIQKIDLGANYLIQAEAIPEDAAIYDSYAVGEHGEHVPQQTIDYPGATEFYLIDTPYLRDAEHYASPYGFYAAACGRLAAWRGAQLFRSLDEGISYQVIQALLNGAIIGTATGALAAPGDPWTWDNDQVTIRLLDEEAELASTSKINCLNGQNAFLLGHPDKGWELCAFCDATLNADGTYTLGTLLRALRGTEWMCAEHSAGDIFILLSTATTYRIAGQAADLDQERLYAAVSLGMPFSSGTLRTFADTGRGLHPYAPVHIKGTRDGSNNLTITAVRRARIDGEWRDLVETPLDETAEAYEVDFIKAGVIVRTVSGLSSPTCVYTAAQQTADGFTPGDPIPQAWYQMSAVVGRGFSGTATV